MRGRAALALVGAASLLTWPAACTSETTHPPWIPASGGASAGGTSWGGAGSSLLGSIDHIDSGSGGQEPWVPPECPMGLDTPFDVCVPVPCPRGIDCSSQGSAGASNGGSAGAAGAASTPTESEPLPVGLCPVQFPPLNPVVGCAPQRYCIDAPTVSDGHLECCYRVSQYHCR